MKEKFLSRAGFEPGCIRKLVGRDIYYTIWGAKTFFFSENNGQKSPTKFEKIQVSYRITEHIAIL